MKNKEKEQFRVKTLQMIEKLMEIDNSPEIPRVEVAGLKPDSDAVHDALFMLPDGEMVRNWTYSFRWLPNTSQEKSFLHVLSELYSTLNSKEAVRLIPPGLYRTLIEFSDTFPNEKKWVNWNTAQLSYAEDKGEPPVENIQKEAERQIYLNRQKFITSVKNIIKEIYFFENERAESEESFFGKEKNTD